MDKYILKVDQDGNWAEDCFAYKLKQLFDKYSIKYIYNGFIGYEPDTKRFTIQNCQIESGTANGILNFINKPINPNNMAKEEFKKEYCINSDITLDYYHEHYITLACNCGQEDCKGWAAVNNNPLSIKAHNDLYR